jgi:hypothetical protein
MAIFVSPRTIRPLAGGVVVLSGLLALLILGSDPVSGQNKTSSVKPAKAAPSPGRADAASGNTANAELFEKSVRPVLVANCYQCHAKLNEMAQGGMQLDSREGLLLGGKRGAALIPGDTEKSLILHVPGQQSEDAAERQIECRGHRGAHEMGERWCSLARRKRESSGNRLYVRYSDA